jgi:hypothetical protein
LLLLVTTSFVLSCGRGQISDPKVYYSYLADPENGLVQQKRVAGLNYKVKYLPVEYLVYNACKESGAADTLHARLKTEYSNSLTFLISIGPDAERAQDITRLDITNYEAFSSRIEQMAFEAQNWVSLLANGKEYRPELVRLENINAQERSRNFIAVFANQTSDGTLLQNENLCLVYSDELFNTGINKFVFKSADMNNIPDFKF